MLTLLHLDFKPLTIEGYLKTQGHAQPIGPIISRQGN